MAEEVHQRLIAHKADNPSMGEVELICILVLIKLLFVFLFLFFTSLLYLLWINEVSSFLMPFKD